MSYFANILKHSREDLGYSQVQLAALSGVSLPTIQNIEAEKANPSFEIIEKLGKALGWSLELKPAPVDWDSLSAWGVPLISKKSRSSVFSPELFVQQIKLACRELSYSNGVSVSDYSRKERALEAALWALESHFPTFYKTHLTQVPLVRQWRIDKKAKELVKLRRIAIETLARYL